MSTQAIRRLEEIASRAHTLHEQGFPPHSYRTVYHGIVRGVLTAVLLPDEAAVVAACKKAAEEQCRPVSVNRKDVIDVLQSYIDSVLDESS